jgi:hypothetical protein
MNENESLADRLSRFTPDGASIDRDTLLFAAGRASARKNRRWMALASVLAASQLITLVFLWPRAPASAPSADSFLASEPPATMDREPVASSPFQLLRLEQSLFANEGKFPPQRADEALVPDEPPLRAFGAILPGQLE